MKDNHYRMVAHHPNLMLAVQLAVLVMEADIRDQTALQWWMAEILGPPQHLRSHLPLCHIQRVRSDMAEHRIQPLQ